MKSSILICISLLALTLQGCSQNSKPATIVGGGCDGCEAIFTSPVPFEKLNWVDTLPDFHEPGPRMVISGIIYQADGKTAAKNVILYVYHTDQSGHYTNKFNEKGPAGRNGYIKGWMKTNEKGQYKFYTLKPVAYPQRKIPAHIHPVIYEPGKNEYYIDEYLFDDDPLLTISERNKQELRGGSGIIVLHSSNGMLVGERNIVLGRHIPGYPVSCAKAVPSDNRTVSRNKTSLHKIAMSE